MIDSDNKSAATGSTAQRGPVKPPAGRVDPEAEARVRGHTYIADEVVSVIARIAAEQVEGVHKLGSSNLRGLFSRFGKQARHGGVDSEIGMKEAAVDIEIIVEFGYPIREVSEALRERVIDTVEQTTGRKVVEVNIWVVDVHVPQVETRPRRELE